VGGRAVRPPTPAFACFPARVSPLLRACSFSTVCSSSFLGLFPLPLRLFLQISLSVGRTDESADEATPPSLISAGGASVPRHGDAAHPSPLSCRLRRSEALFGRVTEGRRRRARRRSPRPSRPGPEATRIQCQTCDPTLIMEPQYHSHRRCQTAPGSKGRRRVGPAAAAAARSRRRCPSLSGPLAAAEPRCHAGNSLAAA
jgi:hypothetical protein